MFSKACVKNSVHEGGGVCGRGACMGGECVWQWGMHGRWGHDCRRHPFQWGCMVGGVVW